MKGFPEKNFLRAIWQIFGRFQAPIGREYPIGSLFDLAFPGRFVHKASEVNPIKGGSCMRTLIVVLAFVLGLTWFSHGRAGAGQLDLGVSIGDEGLRSFYLSVGQYYHVPEPEVIVIRERGIYPEHIPVVLFLSRSARVRPETIIDHRLSGLSWMDITVRLGLGPEIYYVPVNVSRGGPPYGKAYGYYKKHPKNHWHRIKLTDRDIVDQVNLKFISEHRGIAPERIMNMRSGGRDFVSMDRDGKKDRHEWRSPRKEQHEKKNKGGEKGKGNGKGNGKGKGPKD
jgi:hypothetical protein